MTASWPVWAATTHRTTRHALQPGRKALCGTHMGYGELRYDTNPHPAFVCKRCARKAELVEATHG